MFPDIIADYVPVVIVLASIHTRHTQVFSRTDIKTAAETVQSLYPTDFTKRSVFSFGEHDMQLPVGRSCVSVPSSVHRVVLYSGTRHSSRRLV